MNSSKVLKIKKQWIRIGKEYHLLIDTFAIPQYLNFDAGNLEQKRLTTREFRVYDIPGNEPVVELNKTLKENDLIEYLQKLLGVEIILI